MTTRLLIARHGNTFGPNDIVRRVGTTDLPLVASGLEQGRQLGCYLQQQRWLPDVVFTSTLQRTIQTAEAAQTSMGTALTIQPLTIFNEINYGPDENQAETDVVSRLGKETIDAWEKDATVPAGWQVDPQQLIQTWLNFAANIADQYADQICLVITSNGIARFAPYITGDFTAFRNQHPIKIATGAVCRFKHTPATQQWTCTHWNIKPKDYL